jgi:hypothetical protein
MGVLEESVKQAGGVIDAMRSQPLALAMGLMNVALLLFLFYYLSRITSRTEITVNSLFQAQDKLYTQWAGVIKDTNALTEKTMHCILPEDAIKLMQVPILRDVPARPAEPLRPQNFTMPQWLPLSGDEVEWPRPEQPAVEEKSRP